MPMSFFEELRNKAMARYPVIYVTAREEWRAAQEVEKVAEALDFAYGSWTVTNGWMIKAAASGSGANAIPKTTQAELKASTNPDDVVKTDLSQKLPAGLYCLVNFHRFLDEPPMIQAIKDLVQLAKGQSKTVVFISNVQKIPAELADDFAVMEFKLPDRDLLAERVKYLIDSTEGQVTMPAGDALDAVIEASLGMTTWEAENAMALSLVEKASLDPKIISREKAKAVNKDGTLEYFEKPPSAGLSDVGGLDNAKAWLRQRRDAFSKEARAYGLPTPKGILVCGVPGTGKSLLAKAVSSEFGLPLVKMDMGRMFGSLVGESERKMRQALAVLESIAPCVAWVDEIEKGMAGAESSGSTDSGVTARVFGQFINWMQDRERPVFIVATGNQVWKLPAAIMRAGRFDEIFCVDLPTQLERVAIFEIHLKKRGRDPEKFDLAAVADKCRLFSGAEIEGVVIKAMFAAFADGRREVETGDLIKAAGETVPLAVTRKEEIDVLREWAASRAKPASSGEALKVEPYDNVELARRRRVLLAKV